MCVCVCECECGCGCGCGWVCVLGGEGGERGGEKGWVEVGVVGLWGGTTAYKSLSVNATHTNFTMLFN